MRAYSHQLCMIAFDMAHLVCKVDMVVNFHGVY